MEDVVVRVFFEFLVSREDIFIVRKVGKEEVEFVLEKVCEVFEGRFSVDEFDVFFREKGDLRNFGSFVDIMVVLFSVLVFVGLKIKVVDGKVWGIMG